MIVRCSSFDGKRPGSRPEAWLKIGRDYLVLAIEGRAKGVTYRVIAYDDSPVLFSATFFTEVDDRVPPHWAFRSIGESSWSLEPAEWSVDNFWIRFFDREPAAIATYDAVLASLKEFHL